MNKNGTVKNTHVKQWALRAAYRISQLMKDVHEGQSMTITFKVEAEKIIMVTPKEEVIG
ncbi:MAG: hypothetical protein GY938_12795 [Ketobacter sp.]|nr:hypothetical protein [Ketobacter sp.]